jgi:hypothetical protein
MKPFSDYDIHSVLSTIIEETKGEIKELNNQYVLKASKTELEEYYINKVIINPIVFHVDKKYIKSNEISKTDFNPPEYRSYFDFDDTPHKILVNVLKIGIPFEGDKTLWKIKPSTFSVSGYPDIIVMENEVILTFTFRDNTDEARIKESIERDIITLSTMVSYLEDDVNKHNQKAPELIKKVINNKFETAKSTTGLIASLGIPIQKTDEPPIYAIPTQRKPKPISMPKVATEKYEPEPILEEKEYQYILDILHSMSLVIERNPKSFSSMNEESIRDHFLLQLNGHYEGGATGETFNASGKTDIIIREKDKNVFIAECKFWHGPKTFSEAIDQLLSYLTWRDSKTALMIFNKNQDSTAVLEKMHEIMEDHPEHKKTEYFNNKNGWSRYIFVKNSEPGKEIIITTQLYDIPKEK